VRACPRISIDAKRVFVSTLFAQQWLDIEDVQPEDLVLQIVRQLVADLRREGMQLGQKRFESFFQSLRDRGARAPEGSCALSSSRRTTTAHPSSRCRSCR